MIRNFIISGICLLISILLFKRYNSGLGASLGSFRKKFLYALSLVAFIAFIIFLNRGYYFSDNQRQKQIVNELKKVQGELDRMIESQIDYSEFYIQDNKLKIRNLILKADCDTIRKSDTIQISTLIKQYFIIEDLIRNRNDSVNLLIKEKYSIIQELTQHLDSNVPKESDTYFNILINILSAFIAFVIAFTFKNKILG